MAALNTGDITVAEGVAGVKEMVKKGRMRYVVGCSGWLGCVAHWPVGGVGEGADFFVSPKNKKKETGVQTQLIARADIYLTLEAVVVNDDTLPHSINTTNQQKSRKTLRAAMYARAQRRESETERQIAKLKRRRRWGFAATAVVVGGYFLGAGGAVRGGLRGEDSTVWQRGVWVEEMRRVVMGIGG